MVDARGGAMRGCRHSGVRVIIPPYSAPQPMRITCRYLRRERLVHPPPLMEGEACASKIIEVGPAGAKFLGPVVIEVPHFASLRGREREIIILRSDHGEVWREHLTEADENLIDEIVSSAVLVEHQQQQLEGQENRPASALDGNFGGGGDSQQQAEKRLTRIVTNEFPQYFAIISRIRQEVYPIGPEGSVVDSQVVPRVQAHFTDGALTKRIKIGLQNEQQDYDADEQRTRSPSAGRRTVSPSGGSKRRSRFLSCFGAGERGERISQGELGFASGSNDESAGSSTGGDSPRQYALARHHIQHRSDVGVPPSDSEGDSLGTLTRSPAHMHRHARPHSLAAGELVPDDYYIEREPALILNGERATYGRRLASSSAQTEPNGYRPDKGKRRGFLVGARPGRSKTQLQIPNYEPTTTIINYQSSQQQPLGLALRSKRPKSADPGTSSPGGYSSLDDISDNNNTSADGSPAAQHRGGADQPAPSKFRTCTIQTDSDSVTVQYVTLAALAPDRVASATTTTNGTSTPAAPTPFDDGYVSGDAKRQAAAPHRKQGRHFLPSCVSRSKDDDDEGEQEGTTIIVEEDGRTVRELSTRPGSRSGSRAGSLARADSSTPTRIVEKTIKTTTTIMGQSFEEQLTSGGEEADESLLTSSVSSNAPTASKSSAKKARKQEKLRLKESERLKRKAEKEAKKEAERLAKLEKKSSPPASRPQSPVLVSAESSGGLGVASAVVARPSQNVKFAPSPNKDYRTQEPQVPQLPEVSENTRVSVNEQSTYVVPGESVVYDKSRVSVHEAPFESPAGRDIEEESMQPVSIGEQTLIYEPPTASSQVPLRPILKQQTSGDSDEPKSLASMAERIVTKVTEEAIREIRPHIEPESEDLPQTSRVVESSEFHFTEEEAEESKREREKRLKKQRSEEKRLLREAERLAKEAQKAAKEAERQALLAHLELERAKLAADESQRESQREQETRTEKITESTTSEFFLKGEDPSEQRVVLPELAITTDNELHQPELKIDQSRVPDAPLAHEQPKDVHESVDQKVVSPDPLKIREPEQPETVELSARSIEEPERPQSPTAKRPRVKPKGARLNCFKLRKSKKTTAQIGGSKEDLTKVREPETKREVTSVVLEESTFPASVGALEEPEDRAPEQLIEGEVKGRLPEQPLAIEGEPKGRLVEQPVVVEPQDSKPETLPKRRSGGMSCFSCASKPKKRVDSLDESEFTSIGKRQEAEVEEDVKAAKQRVKEGKIKARSKLDKDAREHKRKKRSLLTRIFHPGRTTATTTTTTTTITKTTGSDLQAHAERPSLDQQIVSEMYPSDPDNADGEMILEVNVPHQLIREPQQPKIDIQVEPKQPEVPELPQQEVPVVRDTIVVTDAVAQPAIEPEQPVVEPKPVDEIIESHHVDPVRPQVAPLAEVPPGRVVEPQVTEPTIRERESFKPSEQSTTTTTVVVDEPARPTVAEEQETREITREVLEHVEDVPSAVDAKEAKRRAKEEAKERKKREKEEELERKRQLKAEKERLKSEAKEAKRLLKLAKLEAKRPKVSPVGDSSQTQTSVRIDRESQQQQLPTSGVPTTTTVSTVTTSTTTRGDPSALNPQVGGELGGEQTTTEGGRLLVSKSSEVPVAEENEVERIVEEVVGEDGTVTKTTKVVETKYVTMRQEEIRVAERRDLSADEWERIRTERAQSSQESTRTGDAGGPLEIMRSTRHYIVREPIDYPTPDLDEIVATPSYFDVERAPEGVDLRASIKKQFAKRVKLNQKIIKRAQKLSWIEAKRAKRDAQRAEREIAVCDCAAREARKELKRAVKEAKRAVREAEKRHKKMDKIDAQIAKRQKKLEKRQKKIDKKLAKAAKEQAKRQAKLDKKALKRAGSSATSAKSSIRLEDIGAPVLHSSSRVDLQRQSSGESATRNFVERHLIITEESTRPSAPTTTVVTTTTTKSGPQVMTQAKGQIESFPVSLESGQEVVESLAMPDDLNMRSELAASRDEDDDLVIDVVGLDDEQLADAPTSAHVISGELSVHAEQANQEGAAQQAPLTPLDSLVVREDSPAAAQPIGVASRDILDTVKRPVDDQPQPDEPREQLEEPAQLVESQVRLEEPEQPSAVASRNLLLAMKPPTGDQVQLGESPEQLDEPVEPVDVTSKDPRGAVELHVDDWVQLVEQTEEPAVQRVESREQLEEPAQLEVVEPSGPLEEDDEPELEKPSDTPESPEAGAGQPGDKSTKKGRKGRKKKNQ